MDRSIQAGGPGFWVVGFCPCPIGGSLSLTVRSFTFLQELDSIPRRRQDSLSLVLGGGGAGRLDGGFSPPIDLIVKGS